MHFTLKFFFFGFFHLLLSQPTLAAPTEAYGLFMVVKGDVKLFSNNVWQPAKVGLKVVPGDSIEAGPDSRAKIVMMDRNVINISPDTKIQIQKYENDPETSKKNATLFLSQGKVRQSVEEEYDGDKSKYIIRTPTAVAGVRGTEFVISHDSVAQKSEVFTLKGQVAFAAVLNGQVVGKSVMIKKGETSSSLSSTPPAPPQKMRPDQIQDVDKSTRTSAFQKDLKDKTALNDKSKKMDQVNFPNKANLDNGKSPLDGKRRQAMLTGNSEFDPSMMPMPPLPPPPPMGRPPFGMGNLPPPNPAAGQIIKDLVNRTNVKIAPR